MKIVAIICARNEFAYLREVIPYLGREQIDVVLIDNDSTDGTLEAMSHACFRNVRQVERLPFNGIYDLSVILGMKASVVKRCDADWVIHHDADEVLHAPTQWGGLRHHIERADRLGFTVLNFNEIVMLPANPGIDDFMRNNSNYYFFEPHPLRLMRAWKKAANLANDRSGGHVLVGANVAIYPERMVLKHFIVRSQQHALQKYLGRTHAQASLDKGWHSNRRNFSESNLTIPTSGPDLHSLGDPRKVPRTWPRPTRTHFWEWPASP